MKTRRHLAQQASMSAYHVKQLVAVRAITDEVPLSTTTKESMTTDIAPSGAVADADVPAHAELRIKALADRLKVGIRNLAAAGGIGASTLHQIVTLDQWPSRVVVRTDKILAMLRDNGATEQELATAFERVAIDPKLARKGSRKDTEPNEPETDAMIGKKTLSMAARKQFSLFMNPFDAEVSSEKEMFLSGEIRFIREACLQTATNGAFVAVIGESGAGKTTILADLKDRVASSNKPVIWIEPSVLGMAESDRVGKTIKSGDILTAGVFTLDPAAVAKQTIEARTRQFVKLLEDSVSVGNNHLLVIEEAHSLPEATLQHLKRLHERTRIGRRSALGILLIGHPELLTKLQKVREVYQRCEVIELQPLDSELGPYLAHKAEVAGKKLSELITDDGVAALRARLTIERRANNGQGVKAVSRVYPLAVNNLFTLALNRAAELGAPIVDKDIVRTL